MYVRVYSVVFDLFATFATVFSFFFFLSYTPFCLFLAQKISYVKWCIANFHVNCIFDAIISASYWYAMHVDKTGRVFEFIGGGNLVDTETVLLWSNPSRHTIFLSTNCTFGIWLSISITVSAYNYNSYGRFYFHSSRCGWHLNRTMILLKHWTNIKHWMNDTDWGLDMQMSRQSVDCWYISYSSGIILRTNTGDFLSLFLIYDCMPCF